MRTRVLAAVIAAASPAVAQTEPDPHQWLEAVTGEKALEWVRARNAKYLPELESHPKFGAWRARAEAVLQDPRRIAYPTGAAPTGVTATQVFNFWRDERNVRGVWRVSPRAAYDAGKPEWSTLIDMDALEAAEQKNFQWGGAQCLPPDFARCLVSLSVGGKDAAEIREFDTAARRFVPAGEGGFASAEAKQTVAWIDKDRILHTTAAGPVTNSGYARDAYVWSRSVRPELKHSVREGDMGAFASAYGEGPIRRGIIDERLTFWTGRIHHLMDDGTLDLAPLPEDVDFRFIADVGDGPRAFALLRSDHKGFPKGSLVSYQTSVGMMQGPLELVFTPGQTKAIADLDATGKAVYLGLLDDVAAKLVRLERTKDGWTRRDVPLPANMALDFVASDSDDTLYASLTGFTEPSRLVRITAGAAPQTIAEAPAFFDGAKFAVSQRFALAKDGTKIPYFIVRPKTARGPLKTLYWSYGGFEIPLLPAYAAPDVMQWLEAGNQYVVANIRGGGEYGPRWHQAALLERRQTSYDDLHTVAEALKREKLASKLAVHGRSNGGLMAAVAYTQRPDLYDAALVGVPLADMRRYHKLLAGASWMAEYGNPDTADWDFIRQYSPYHNLKAGADYPRVFFYTSTKDDRVHPAHARKMAAEMERLGHPIYYYENVDGGHAGVANLKENAYRVALMLAYLDKELK